MWKNIFEFKRNNRSGNIINIPISRINLCERNIFIYATKLYNSLPSYLRLNDNFMLKIKKCEKIFYNIYNHKYI